MLPLLATLALVLPQGGTGSKEDSDAVLPQYVDESQILSYTGQQTLVDHDSLIQFNQSIGFKQAGVELKASWGVIWIDRQEASRLSSSSADEDRDAAPQRVPKAELKVANANGVEPPIPNIFQQLAQSRLSELAREMYLEGPVELFVEGERMLLADAIYLDLVDGHGWIANVTATAKRRIGPTVEKLLVRADWMRYSADGSLRADSAIVTTGDFEDSSLSISTGDLRIRPTRLGETGDWEFRLRQNRIHLVGGLWLPLPPLTFGTDAKGKPILETFGFGDNARLGSFIQATFNHDMGSAGKKINDIFKGDPKNYNAHYSLKGSYLGSRGVLADGGIEIESDDHYWLKFQFAAVSDGDEDRGFIRVDPDRRDRWRRWARAYGRYLVDDEEWVQLRFSTQTDPGVQSEFFERDFLNYEQRNTDVVWRRGSDQNYFSASARVQTDDYRTDTEELPELRYHTGATDIAALFGRPLLYRSDSTAGYLRRRDGDPRFSELFPDGLGDREVLRVGTRQRLSLPLPLGFAGLRATPFLEGIAAGWDRDTLDAEEAGRAAALGGVVLSTHLWRSMASGGTLQVAPFISWTGDIASAETDAVPVVFDQFEERFEGEVAALGLHSVWQSRTGQHWFDTQIRSSYVSERGDSEDGWAPTQILAGLTTRIGDVPVGVFHDGRYSAEGEGTLYSLTDVGLRLTPDLALEVGHRRARDEGSGDPLFEAVSLGGRYRWTEKWEFEGRHQISLFDNTRLEDRYTIRRFGYDVVLDITLSHRAGEGTSIGFRVEPRIIYSQRDLGSVRALRQ